MSQSPTTPAAAPTPTPTPPAQPATQPATPVPEATPQLKRGGRLIVWIVLGVLLLALALGVAGYRSWTRGTQAQLAVAQATTLIERADVTVVEVDEVVRAEISTEVAAAASQAGAGLPEASGHLREALDLLEGALPVLRDERRARAEALSEAAQARIDMLSQAPAIIEATTKAATALPLADEALRQAREADELSRRAVSSYNKLTRASVTAAKRLNGQAATKLASARDGMERAEAAFPEAAFEVYLAYLDLRIELNRLSQQSDDAWLKGDITKTNAAIATYNEKDKQAVEQSKALPVSPARAVADAYEAAAGAATEEYFSARDRATAADAKVRRD